MQTFEKYINPPRFERITDRSGHFAHQTNDWFRYLPTPSDASTSLYNSRSSGCSVCECTLFEHFSLQLILATSLSFFVYFVILSSNRLNSRSNLEERLTNVSESYEYPRQAHLFDNKCRFAWTEPLDSTLQVSQNHSSFSDQPQRKLQKRLKFPKRSSCERYNKDLFKRYPATGEFSLKTKNYTGKLDCIAHVIKGSLRPDAWSYQLGKTQTVSCSLDNFNKNISFSSFRNWTEGSGSTQIISWSFVSLDSWWYFESSSWGSRCLKTWNWSLRAPWRFPYPIQVLKLPILISFLFQFWDWIQLREHNSSGIWGSLRIWWRDWAVLLSRLTTRWEWLYQQSEDLVNPGRRQQCRQYAPNPGRWTHWNCEYVSSRCHWRCGSQQNTSVQYSSRSRCYTMDLETTASRIRYNVQWWCHAHFSRTVSLSAG